MDEGKRRKKVIGGEPCLAQCHPALYLVDSNWRCDLDCDVSEVDSTPPARVVQEKRDENTKKAYPGHRPM